MNEDRLTSVIEIGGIAAINPVAGIVTGVSPAIRRAVFGSNSGGDSSNQPSGFPWTAVIFLAVILAVIWITPKLLHETTGLVKAVW